jgi:hypothetical protein
LPEVYSVLSSALTEGVLTEVRAPGAFAAAAADATLSASFPASPFVEEEMSDPELPMPALASEPADSDPDEEPNALPVDLLDPLDPLDSLDSLDPLDSLEGVLVEFVPVDGVAEGDGAGVDVGLGVGVGAGVVVGAAVVDTGTEAPPNLSWLSPNKIPYVFS